MSQLRHDPLSGCDAIIAAGRAARPNTFHAASRDATGAAACPFCPGHEHDTPPEVARTGGGSADTPGWRVRVFPNKFPIVGDEVGIPGRHEVVVLSPDHTRSFGQLDDVGVVDVFTMLRDRVRTHLDAGLRYAVATINHLDAAGASIFHPHAQVFALDFVPHGVQGELDRFAAAGTDLVVADAAHEELRVVRRDAVTAWCPPASTSRYQLRIAHDDAGPAFDAAGDAMVADVGFVLREALARLALAVDGDVPHNMVVHTAPRGHRRFRWYVEVTPRLSVTAGFEHVTGILVNSTPPEQAASELRAALVP